MLARGFEQGYTPNILLQFCDSKVFIFKDTFQSSCGNQRTPAFGSRQPWLGVGLWGGMTKAALHPPPRSACASLDGTERRHLCASTFSALSLKPLSLAVPGTCPLQSKEGEARRAPAVPLMSFAPRDRANEAWVVWVTGVSLLGELFLHSNS